ncbi:hypothetical protein Taro_013659 [Colocasia esculenta]|uniref:Nucleoside phosphorylase domain-containing protein n=1 Tax=Colocasia esculenta TaxID=4460 RepID=A0A843UCP3_COLES|nr:hypothetical protein [Colocasia esculenta]
MSRADTPILEIGNVSRPFKSYAYIKNDDFHAEVGPSIHPSNKAAGNDGARRRGQLFHFRRRLPPTPIIRKACPSRRGDPHQSAFICPDRARRRRNGLTATMAAPGPLLLLLLLLAFLAAATVSEGKIPMATWKQIRRINRAGPRLGVVVPNAFEMNPLLQSSSFVPDEHFPFLDFAGRRFRFGTIEKKRVIVVMTGLSMLNAGLATQLLLDLFEVEGVVHYGIAGNANPDLQIGDVVVPRYWAHTGLWVWQRYGDGPNDELPLESAGDYTRELGYLRFSDFSNATGNTLNRVWYQREEIFPVDGVPEQRQHAFWVPANAAYFGLAEKLEVVILQLPPCTFRWLLGLELDRCVNSSTCLPRRPAAMRVARGCSANTFVDNAAYRGFLSSKLNVTAIDMESAAVALVCLQQRRPFIAFRALSDLAGGGSAQSNEASVFAGLAAGNAVAVAVKFISMLDY